MLTPDQKNKYSRQIRLPELGIQGQEKLQKAKVLIVGVGGLGCPAAQYLAAAGVGMLGLMDYDRVDISNLHRQILFTVSDVGRPKAEVAKTALSRLNNEAKIITYNDGLSVKNAISVFSEYDLVIDGTDNFQSKYLINDACVKTGKPWVYASIYKYQGQLSVFNFKNGPTYRCLFPKSSTGDISCEETGVIGVLPGVLGTLQAAEAVKLILEIGDVLSGKMKIIDTLTMQDHLTYFEKDEAQISFIKERDLEPEVINCKLKSTDKIYLDVREPFEQPKPVSDKILHIPMNQLMERYTEIPKDQMIYVYCQSGIRSEKAIRLLSENFGFTNLQNVKEGIQSIVE
jgi:sulfur-carrier protein adenylyltransferase/sulfurtransferase